MKENRPNQTDQQATNAALAALAAAGNSFALGQLWEVNKGFLHRLFWQWYSQNKAVADNAGLTLEDFDQEAFFAVQAAAIAYTPEAHSRPCCITTCKVRSIRPYSANTGATSPPRTAGGWPCLPTL